MLEPERKAQGNQNRGQPFGSDRKTEGCLTNADAEQLTKQNPEHGPPGTTERQHKLTPSGSAAPLTMTSAYPRRKPPRAAQITGQRIDNAAMAMTQSPPELSN